MTQGEERKTMLSFKGTHFPKDIMLMGVLWSVAYPLGSGIEVMLCQQYPRRIVFFFNQLRDWIPQAAFLV